MAVAVALDGVRFAWPGGFTLAIERFEVAAGEKVLLVGPSGGGKSTLLSLVCGTVLAQSGAVKVLEQDLARLSGAARDRFRAERIGVIFQMFNLLPYLSVRDNVLLPLGFAPQRRQKVDDPATEAGRLLGRLGLEPALLRQPAASLSVGQQQRAAAARALIGAPDLVVADEPTSALDQDRRDDFLTLLFEEVARAGATLLMVSHDATLGGRFDRQVRLDGVLA
jgi:putative ABC transport system ATP-binding protein